MFDCQPEMIPCSQLRLACSQTHCSSEKKKDKSLLFVASRMSVPASPQPKTKMALVLSTILQISASVVAQTQMAVAGKRQETTQKKPTKPIAATARATL